jgi:hypothetical protein
MVGAAGIGGQTSRVWCVGGGGGGGSGGFIFRGGGGGGVLHVILIQGTHRER